MWLVSQFVIVAVPMVVYLLFFFVWFVFLTHSIYCYHSRTHHSHSHTLTLPLFYPTLLLWRCIVAVYVIVCENAICVQFRMHVVQFKIRETSSSSSPSLVAAAADNLLLALRLLLRIQQCADYKIGTLPIFRILVVSTSTFLFFSSFL